MTNPQSATRNPQSLDGVLVIDKPAGWTSHDVVARVRKILKTRRVGHTGTLDPFATGVLVVCVNRATRLVQFLAGDDKEYLATMRLGFATDTGDLTGRPVSQISDVSHITEEAVKATLDRFRGRINQIPPMYSAKKVGGVRLYEMARRGEQIRRAPIEVEIKELELISGTQSGERSGDFTFRVVCSSGTYIRTLAEDIGALLGAGAHLRQLRRTRAGACDLDRALTLEGLAELAEVGRIEEHLIPPVEVIGLCELAVSDDEKKAISHGRSIRREGKWLSGALAKLCGSDRRLVAIAEFDADSQLWRPRLVWENPEKPEQQ
jgi:tRNA pseudouridine55 synthase